MPTNPTPTPRADAAPTDLLTADGEALDKYWDATVSRLVAAGELDGGVGARFPRILAYLRDRIVAQALGVSRAGAEDLNAVKREGWDEAIAWMAARPEERLPRFFADQMRNERDRRYPEARRHVVLSWGVMDQDEAGQWCVWSDVAHRTILSVTANAWEHVRCFEDAEAIRAHLAAAVQQEGA